jgi:hypothetical protein
LLFNCLHWSSGSTKAPDSSTEPKIIQGKKYVKPTKIQFLDITTATAITQNQEENKLKIQMGIILCGYYLMYIFPFNYSCVKF